jgi:hypothetical protein
VTSVVTPFQGHHTSKLTRPVSAAASLPTIWPTMIMMPQWAVLSAFVALAVAQPGMYRNNGFVCVDDPSICGVTPDSGLSRECLGLSGALDTTERVLWGNAHEQMDQFQYECVGDTSVAIQTMSFAIQLAADNTDRPYILQCAVSVLANWCPYLLVVPARASCR